MRHFGHHDRDPMPPKLGWPWATILLVVGFLIFLMLLPVPSRGGPFPGDDPADPYSCYGSSRYEAMSSAWPACNCDVVKLMVKSCFAARLTFRVYGKEDGERLARACQVPETKITEAVKCLSLGDL